MLQVRDGRRSCSEDCRVPLITAISCHRVCDATFNRRVRPRPTPTAYWRSEGCFGHVPLAHHPRRRWQRSWTRRHRRFVNVRSELREALMIRDGTHRFGRCEMTFTVQAIRLSSLRAIPDVHTQSVETAGPSLARHTHRTPMLRVDRQ